MKRHWFWTLHSSFTDICLVFADI